MGKLIVVPSPIGNLDDMSKRVTKALKESDLNACEDTRTTGRLLKHIDSKVQAIAYHMHNEMGKSEDILKLLEEGKTIALVSDAGMPGISDPGRILIDRAIEGGHEVSVLPGPSAFVTALVGSGLPTNRFTFIGFLDKNRTKRKKDLEELKDKRETLIFYEAPHRLKEFLSLLYEVLGNRRACLSRELTKIYEEYERGHLKDLIAIYDDKEARGEYVIILEGKTEEELREEIKIKHEKISIEDQVKELMEKGHSKMDAVKITAKERGLKKNEVYIKVVDL